MFFRRALIPFTMALLLMVQFFPGTSLGPQSAAAAVTCTNLAQFVADVTIPDGTTVAPNSTFVKTWRLQNAGTCTWTTSYAVVFTGGDQLGSPASIAMPASVAPGGTVDINVNLTAPAAPGHYRGNYKLKSDTGVLFGVGASASFLFWVDINVGTTLSNAFDFIAQASSATWSSGAGTLPFPGTDGDVKGFALPAATPQLENGTTSATPGLIVNPQQVSGGFIQGVYPAFTVQAGDRFTSIVNCAFNATKCYVNFRLGYRIGSGPVNTLWTFNERYEGLFFRASVDLSSLAGQTVNFVLYVADVPGHGLPSGDRAEWVNTMIARGGGGGVPIPPPSVCDRGAFVSDVTIPDGSVVAPGQTFVKTWRVRNIGSCSWTSNYALVFVLGNTFGAASPTLFSTTGTVSVLPVAPGQTADFSLTMTAPTAPGHYRSFWRFQNGSGVQFGVGSGMITFFADINVSGTAPTVTPGGPITPTSTAIITGPSADLSINVEDNLNVYTPGGTVTYTITVMNNGPFAVTHATLVDHKPSPHVTSWTWTCVADVGASCTTGPTTSAADVSDDITLPVGKKVVYTVVATINPSAVGNLVNTGTITNPAAVPDPNLANNSDTDTDAPPGTNLTVSMTQNTNTGTNMYNLGGTIVYSIQMINVGPLGVTGATFTDPIPNQISTWTWVCTTTGGAVWTGPGTTTGNVSTTVNMPAGSSITCTVTATVKTTVTGDITNTITLLSPLSVPDSVPSDNTASTTAVGPNADLSVTKTDGVTTYTPGGTLTYTVTVSNAGPLIVNGATFTDNMPTQFSSWSWTCAADTGAICTAGPSAVAPINDTITLPKGNKVVYTIVATVNPAATGSVVNTATVQSIATIPDLNPGNNSATDTDMPPSADVQITQKSDFVDVYTPGGTLNYTIDVFNSGPQDVANAHFLDVKPAQIASWTWSCAPTTLATVTCTPPGFTTAGNFEDFISIPKGVTIRYSVVATVNTATTGDLVNTATVDMTTATPPTDPNLANNSKTDTDRHPTANLSVTIVDNVTTYLPGTASNYTVTVTNLGPDKATNAIFTADWPLGTLTSAPVLNNWTWTCVAGLQSSCSAFATPASGAPFTDTVTLAAGGSVTYTVVANVLPGATEPIPFRVTIASGAAPFNVDDPNLGNNVALDVNSGPINTVYP